MHSFATLFLVMCPQNGMELYKNWGRNKMRQRSCTGSPKRDSRHSVCQQFRPNWVHCKYCWKVWRRSAPNRRNNSAGKPNFLCLHFQNRSHIRWRRPWTQWQIHTSKNKKNNPFLGMCCDPWDVHSTWVCHLAWLMVGSSWTVARKPNQFLNVRQPIQDLLVDIRRCVILRPSKTAQKPGCWFGWSIFRLWNLRAVPGNVQKKCQADCTRGIYDHHQHVHGPSRPGKPCCQD